MRVSTMGMNQRNMNSIFETQARANTLLLQISSGKRVLNPGDDPVSASKANTLKVDNAMLNTYQRNITHAENSLSLVETTLNNMNNDVLRLYELEKQAANGTVNAGDKAAIALEMSQILSDMVALANTQDANGDYIFAGSKTSTQPVSLVNGQYVYHGDETQRYSQVGSSTMVATSFSGHEVFDNIMTGNGYFTTTDGANTNTGSGVITLGRLTDSSQYIADQYDIMFVTNSNGDLAYQVTDSVGDQVIPPLPASIPSDAPAYVAGENIQFNGMEIAISGAPNAGDDFSIVPSSKQNIFTTTQNMIDTLNMPTTTETERAAFENQLIRDAAALDNSIDRMVLMSAKVGANMKTLENQTFVNQDLINNNQKTLSMIEDLDYAEAITMLSYEMLALQTAQASFMKINQLSMINYLL